MDGSWGEESFPFYGFGREEGFRSPNAHENELMVGEQPFLMDSSGEDGESSNPPPSSTEEESEVDQQEEAVAGEEEAAEEPPIPDYAIRTRAQSEMGESVINALLHNKNLLLECPPGCERMITVLKAILEFYQWKNHPNWKGSYPFLGRKERTKPSRIFIGTRNYNESCSCLREIKEQLVTTKLLWKIKISLLHHRHKLCLNPNVLGEGSSPARVDLACRQCVRRSTANIPSTSKKSREDVGEEGEGCDYYENSMRSQPMPFVIGSASEDPLELESQHVNDMEDFLEHCGQTNRCPYFDTRQLAQDADLVICPAEMLLSPALRREYGINLENAIVLFDDGFNLELACRQQATLDITVGELVKVADFVSRATERFPMTSEDSDDDGGLAVLSTFLTTLSQWPTDNTDNRPDRAEILEFLQSLMPNPNVLHIPRIICFLEECEDVLAPSLRADDAESIHKLRKFICTLDLLLRHPDSFSVKLTTRDAPCNSEKPSTVLEITCADPSLLLRPVDSATHSIIVSSSCLAPYQPFSTEFGVAFEGPLKIVPDPYIRERLLFLYSGKSPNGSKFTLNYESRNDPRVKREAGCAVLNLCKVIPHGKIALFHSDDYLKRIRQYWQTNQLGESGEGTIWDAINNVSRVFCELDIRTPEDETRLMAEFKQAAATPQGAILLALTRRKLYDEWETRFQTVRGIIHISIPFGPWYSDKDIVSKRKFLERKHGEQDCLQNKDHYHKEAFRKINRSLACCLQDVRRDFGVVVVLDSRMAAESHEFDDTLPEWLITPTNCPDFDSLLRKTARKVELFNTRNES